MNDGAIFHAHAIDGVFKIRSVNGKTILEFDATFLKRFTVAVAYFVEGHWRLRYRLLVTHQQGVLFFPIHKTLENRNGVYRAPPEFDDNTVLIIGIATVEVESNVTIRIYANELGRIDNVFNGNVGTVKFNTFLDSACTSDNLKKRKYGNTIRFDQRLYRLTQSDQCDELRRQNFDDTWCANCFLVSAPANDAIQHYRTNIYTQSPMPMFKITIDQQHDKLYVFDKPSGCFKVTL